MSLHPECTHKQQPAVYNPRHVMTHSKRINIPSPQHYPQNLKPNSTPFATDNSMKMSGVAENWWDAFSFINFICYHHNTLNLNDDEVSVSFLSSCPSSIQASPLSGICHLNRKNPLKLVEKDEKWKFTSSMLEKCENTILNCTSCTPYYVDSVLKNYEIPFSSCNAHYKYH